MAVTTGAPRTDWLMSTEFPNTSLFSNITESYLEEEEEEEFDALRVNKILFTYVAPVLIFVGVFGNTLSLAVLQSKNFRNAPSSFILSALAVVDTGVLLTGLLRHWVKNMTGGQLEVRNFSPGGCKMHFLLTYMLPQLSSWTLVLMTVERLMSVVIPLKAREVCSKIRMLTAWVIIFGCLFAINGHTFKTVTLYTFPRVKDNATIIMKVCFYTRSTRYFTRKIWPWVDIMLLSLIPAIIVFGSNIVIIIQVVRAAKKRSEQMSAKGGGKANATQSLTIMLIAISIVFLFTTTPVSIYFLGLNIWPRNTPKENFETEVAYSSLNILYYFNAVLNFFMYCISGARFRRTLIAILCCRNVDPRKSTLAATSARGHTKTTKLETGAVDTAHNIIED